jgi:hypothetical protein
MRVDISHYTNNCQPHRIHIYKLADYKVFSQTGEDGIIDYLLYSLNIKVPKFVEIAIPTVANGAAICS